MSIQEVLVRSAEELHERAKGHQRLLIQVMEGEGSEARFDECIFQECPHKHKLRKTLVEVIQVLEETRKAFKSKQLEALRKKLIRVLAEDA
ncbi:MAG: hypothetical protein ABIK28_06290 [Planctomycetota bacterium]